MHIVITGAQGFIGKNLLLHLKDKVEHTFFHFDVNNDINDLIENLSKADLIIHLAGVNRPKDEIEFTSGNVDLTNKILDTVKATGRKPAFILSSSVQAELDNPYGISKLQAENAVIRYGKESGARVYVFRLQNVFGKWCRPFYNSVVATFCHQVAHDDRIRIDDPTKEIEFIYIDDVVLAFMAVINGKLPDADKVNDSYFKLRNTSKVSLGRLADLLLSFRQIQNNSIIPDFSDRFTKNLYSTYLSYLEPDKVKYTCQKREDQRGYLYELLKSSSSGQFFFSRTKPGITRGNHYHNTKTEKFCVVQGRARVAFRRLSDDIRWDFIVDGLDCSIIDIPPGCTHSITNIGSEDLLTLFWANEIFDQDSPDTYYCEV